MGRAARMTMEPAWKMDLLKHIRSERAQQKTKQPFQRGLFERINGLVKEYSLGENFLKRLEDSATSLPAESLGASAKAFGRPKAKVPFEPPLFSLSTEEEYRVTTAIIKKVNNPYLRFVHSPDEILLCEPLFRRNPSLDPDKLARYHFETLLLDELAKEQARDLWNRVMKDVRQNIGTKPAAD